MASGPETRDTLMIRLKDPENVSAWDEFVAIYRPVIVRIARSRGLQHADADDLAQQVLLSVSQKIPQWSNDPERARFRTWLGRVVRNAALSALSRRTPDRGTGGTSALLLINGKAADTCEDTEVFDLEARREAFRRASDQIREEFQPTTWEAFWLTAVEGLDAAEAGRRTGKTVGAVYVSRSRVMARLQQKVRQLVNQEAVEVPR
jgi:RNA polymerase sigma factor (sigma-70 family)